MSRRVVYILLTSIVCSPVFGSTVLWLTADEGTPGQPALTPVDSGDYALTVSGQNGVLYSSDVAGVGAAASPYERSFRFDGINDLIRVTHNTVLNLTGSYTIEFFVKLTGAYTPAAEWQLFERQAGGQEYSMYADPDPYADLITYLVGGGGGGGFAGSGTLPAQNTWNHVALVYDANDTAQEAKVYINGVYKTGRNYITGQGTNFSMTADLLLGASGVYGSRYLNGLLDEVRITDRALTPPEFLNVVPEPGTVGLLLWGAVLVGRSRRSRG